jgi:hypothetical protein
MIPADLINTEKFIVNNYINWNEFQNLWELNKKDWLAENIRAARKVGDAYRNNRKYRI